MKRAAATVAGGRNGVVAFEATPPVRRAIVRDAAFPGAAAGAGEPFVRTSSGQGEANMPSAAAIAIMTAAFVTLLVQAALAFQKYRFDSGLMLGTTLAAVNWYEDAVRRKGLPASRWTLILIATSAAALTLALQQAARVLAIGLPQSHHALVTAPMLTTTTFDLKWLLSTSTNSSSLENSHATFGHSSCASRSPWGLQGRKGGCGRPVRPHGCCRSQTRSRRSSGRRRSQTALRERFVIPRRGQGACPARRCRSYGQTRRHAGDARYAGLSEPPALRRSGGRLG